MPADPLPSDSRLLDRLLIGWVEAAARRATLTVVVMLLITAGLGVYAARNLSFNVDPNALFSADLRFQKAIVRFSEYFPVLTNSLLVVVDGPTPEATREAAARLLPALDSQREVFLRAFQPGEDRFFERHGLLYGSLDDLDNFADHMALLQPVLGELAHNLSLPTLADVIQLGLEQDDVDVSDSEGWPTVLDHLREVADAVQAGDRSAHSWEELLVSAAGIEPSTRSVIVVDPILDMERVLGAERAIDAVRATVEQLELGLALGASVRITGYPALNHEEMLGLAKDTAVAGALSFLLVVLVLLYAFRSVRLVAAAALTLIVGIVWSAAFSAAAVRDLNPISITFGVLVVGLGIDFMIHLGMHFVDAAVTEKTSNGALLRATRETGSALVLCAATTGLGFLAFAPTDYRGVSDLGVAAAGGMLAVLLQTLTLFPALLRLIVGPSALERLGKRDQAAAFGLPAVGHPGLVCAVAGALAIGVALLLPRVDLDTNVISFRNPETESVQAFKDLLESEATTPWFLDALAPSLERAIALADDMRELPQVDEVVTLTDFVPSDQEDKLELLADTALFLALPEQVTRREVSAEEQVGALRQLRDFLATEPIASDSPLGESIRALRESLDPYVSASGDSAKVRAYADALLDPLPDQFARLRANIEVGAITQEELPIGLQQRMLAKDGHARIQVYPAEDLWDHEAMVDFVEAVRPIWSEITGLPVNLVESARATWASLREALLWSGIAITLVLLGLWRNIGDTLITLVPLCLAVLLTQVSTVLLPVSLNFANVIVLPLLLGIGVDSGIHMVQRASELGGDTKAMLHSTTARAVTLSAVTTVASFGTLSISGHRGVSSLGVLLTIGMLWTFAANLVLLPALLELRARRRRQSSTLPKHTGRP